MSRRLIVPVATFTLGLALGAGITVRAQLPSTETFKVQTDTAGRVLSTTKREPVVLKSDALALRVTGRNGRRVVGTLVANVDGSWVEVQIAPQDSLASQR